MLITQKSPLWTGREETVDWRPLYLEFLSHRRASRRCWSADAVLLNTVAVVGQRRSHCVSGGGQAVNTIPPCNSFKLRHEWVFWLRVVDEGKRRLSRDARRETLPSIDSKDLLPTTWGGGPITFDWCLANKWSISRIWIFPLWTLAMIITLPSGVNENVA